MVVLKEENLPPLQWKLGHIVKLHPKPDDVTRVVSVRISTLTWHSHQTSDQDLHPVRKRPSVIRPLRLVDLRPSNGTRVVRERYLSL